MRTLALLVVLGPSLAFAKPHGHDKSHATASASSSQSSSETRAEPMRSNVMVEQANDDERPGSRQKK